MSNNQSYEILDWDEEEEFSSLRQCSHDVIETLGHQYLYDHIKYTSLLDHKDAMQLACNFTHTILNSETIKYNGSKELSPTAQVRFGLEAIYETMLYFNKIPQHGPLSYIIAHILGCKRSKITYPLATERGVGLYFCNVCLVMVPTDKKDKLFNARNKVGILDQKALCNVIMRMQAAANKAQQLGIYASDHNIDLYDHLQRIQHLIDVFAKDGYFDSWQQVKNFDFIENIFSFYTENKDMSERVETYH